MRLSISGTACQGKTTLIKEMLNKWPAYETPKASYRDIIKKNNKKKTHSKNTNKATQWDILNHMIDELENYDKDSHVVFDRCPLDNLIYSMWACYKEIGDIDELFIDKCIPIVKESMKFIDIIFYTPITNVSQDDIEDDGERETDIEYIKEIDNLFKAMYKNWAEEDTRFFPKEDRAAMIEIFGTTEERLHMLGLYINEDGNMYGDEESLVDTNILTDQFGFPVNAPEDDISFNMDGQNKPKMYE